VVEFNPPLSGSNGVNDDVPHVTQLFAIIYAIQFWLAWHPEHRVLVHCNTGVQQTGYVIATYLAYTGEMEVSDTMDALHYFKRFRVKDEGLQLTRAARFILLNVNGLLHLPPAPPAVHYMSHLFVQLPGPMAEQDYHAPIVHVYQGRHRVFDSSDVRVGAERSTASLGSPTPQGRGHRATAVTSPVGRHRSSSNYTAHSQEGGGGDEGGVLLEAGGEFAPTPLGAHRMLWTNGSLKVPVHRLLTRDIQVRVYSYAVARAEDGSADAEDCMNAEFDAYHQQRADMARLGVDEGMEGGNEDEDGPLDEMTEACDFTAFLETKRTTGLQRRLVARFAFHTSMLPSQALGMKGDNIDVVCRELVDAHDVQFDLVLMTPEEAGLTGRRPRHHHGGRAASRPRAATDGCDTPSAADTGPVDSSATQRLPGHLLDSLNWELHRIRSVAQTHPESLLNLRGVSAQLAGMTVLSNAHVSLVDSEMFHRLSGEGWDPTALTTALQCTNNNFIAARTVLSGGLLYKLGALSWAEVSLAMEAGRVRSRGGGSRSRGALMSGQETLSTYALQEGVWGPAAAAGHGLPGAAQLAVRASPLRRTRQQLARDEAPVSPGGRTLLPPASPLTSAVQVQDTALVDITLNGPQGVSNTLSLTREELYAVRTVLMQRGTGVVHTTTGEAGEHVPLFNGARGSAFADAGVITGNSDAAGQRLLWGGSPHAAGRVGFAPDTQESIDVSALVAAVASGLGSQAAGGAGGSSGAGAGAGLRGMASVLADVAEAGSKGRQHWESQGAAIEQFFAETAEQLGEGGVRSAPASHRGSVAARGAFEAASVTGAGADQMDHRVLSEAAEHIRAAVRDTNLPEGAQTRLIQALSILEHAEIAQRESMVAGSNALTGLSGRRASLPALPGTAKAGPLPTSTRASPALRPAVSPLHPQSSAYTMDTPVSTGTSTVDTLFRTPAGDAGAARPMPYGAPSSTSGSACFRSPPIGPFDAISIASAAASAGVVVVGGADSDSTGSPPSGARSPARSRGATLELLADLGRGPAGGSGPLDAESETVLLASGSPGRRAAPPTPLSRHPEGGAPVDLLAPYDARAVIIARLREKVAAALSPDAIAAATSAAATSAVATAQKSHQSSNSSGGTKAAPAAQGADTTPAGSVKDTTGPAAAGSAAMTPPAAPARARDTPALSDSPKDARSAEAPTVPGKPSESAPAAQGSTLVAGAPAKGVKVVERKAKGGRKSAAAAALGDMFAKRMGGGGAPKPTPPPADTQPGSMQPKGPSTLRKGPLGGGHGALMAALAKRGGGDAPPTNQKAPSATDYSDAKAEPPVESNEGACKMTTIPLGQHEVWGKYFKMIKVGLPRPIVEHKMEQEGHGAFKWVLEKQESDMSPDPEGGAPPVGPPLGQHPQFAKYFKMLKFGVPPPAAGLKLESELSVGGVLPGCKPGVTGLQILQSDPEQPLPAALAGVGTGGKPNKKPTKPKRPTEQLRRLHFDPLSGGASGKGPQGLKELLGTVWTDVAGAVTDEFMQAVLGGAAAGEQPQLVVTPATADAAAAMEGSSASLLFAAVQDAKTKLSQHREATAEASGGELPATEAPDDAVWLLDAQVKELFVKQLSKTGRPVGNGGEGGSKSKTASSKPQRVNLLDAKKSMNVGIALSGIKMRYSDAAAALLQLRLPPSALGQGGADAGTAAEQPSVDPADPRRALTAGELDALSKILPTQDELTAVTGYRGDAALLGEPEQFYLAIAPVTSLQPRVDALQFAGKFSESVSDISRRMGVIASALRAVASSAALKQFLAAVLVLGNRMNGVWGGVDELRSAPKTVHGFALSSLSKLDATKSFKGGYTTLSFLVKRMRVAAPAVLRFTSDLKPCGAAARVPLDAVLGDIQALRAGLGAAEGLLKDIRERMAAGEGGADELGGGWGGDDSSDSDSEGGVEGGMAAVYSSPLYIFVGRAQRSMTQLSDDATRIESSYEQVGRYLGDASPPPPEQLFGQLRDFCERVKFVQAQQEAKEVREKRAAPKAPAGKKPSKQRRHTLAAGTAAAGVGSQPPPPANKPSRPPPAPAAEPTPEGSPEHDMDSKRARV